LDSNIRRLFGRAALTIAILAVLFAGTAVYVIIQMPWMNWDNTEADQAATLPGDNLSPNPNWSYTHAIDVKAPAERIWPWIDQIGAERGGFYSYDILENLAGCRLKNADRVHPEWQYKGDGNEYMILHPKMPGLKVEKVIPNLALIVHAGNFVNPLTGTAKSINDKDYVNMTWVFYLQKTDWNKTRLMVRWRSCYYPSKENEMWYGPRFTGFMNFIMGDAMIRGIKSRAENSKL
jgi:hypothetical protein